MVREKDPCWEYAARLDETKIKCNFCDKIFGSGGISRLKRHLSGIPNQDASLCPNVSPDVVELVRSVLKLKQENREGKEVSVGREKDPCWQYVARVDWNKIKCNFCDKIFRGGGINRLKNHLSGTPNHHAPLCPNVTPDAVELVRSVFKIRQEAREAKEASGEKKLRLTGPESSENSPTGKAIIPIEPSLSPAPRFVTPCSAIGPGILSSVDNTWKGKEKESAERYIAQFFFENNLDFNLACSSSFQLMLDAVSKCSHRLKCPSAETLRTTWLQRIKSEIEEKSKAKIEEWEKTGCTIIANGWTDNKTRVLINFFASSPAGTIFLKSVDASGYFKNEKYLFDLFDSVIQEVGSGYVVQVITDYSSTYISVGKLIMKKYNTIFWTSCATHCLDLILEDIAKLEWVSRCIIQAQSLTKFIYNHTWVLDFMRKFTNGKEIVCPCITRFVTDFMSLQSLLKQKSRLKHMFTSPEYLDSPYANNAQSLACVDVIGSEDFWRTVEEVVVVSKPLLEALREVEGGKPAMGSVYESLSKVKEAIASYYTRDGNRQKILIKMIDRRWKNQLHSPLHSVGAYLNPSIQYNPSIKLETGMKEEFFNVLEQILPTPELRQDISSQIISFKKAAGMFGYNIAIESRNSILPANWWEEYGDSAPVLQRIAVRVLSQVCSAWVCKRNWSIVQQIHSRKNRCLNKETVNDLVYINCNLKLEALASERMSDVDPITVDDSEMISEWVDEMENPTNFRYQEWLDQFDSTAYCGDLNTKLVDGSVFD